MGLTGYAVGNRSQIQRQLNLTPEVLLMHRDNT